jgi:transposase
VTPFGFLCWDIIEGTVDEDIFSAFLDNTLSPLLTASQIGIIDNASIHHTVRSRISLEQVFNGKYYFSPPYSPHLKPIEGCFALVKNYIRQNEHQALNNPLQYLHHAFTQFSIGHQFSNKILGHWKGYITANNYFNA